MVLLTFGTNQISGWQASSGKRGWAWGQISGWKARATIVCPEVGQVSGDSSVNVPYDDTRSPCCSVPEMPCKNGICLRCQVTGLAFRRRGRFLAI